MHDDLSADMLAAAETDIRVECDLSDVEGNTFHLAGAAGRCLRRAGQAERAVEMYAEIKETTSFDEALRVIFTYVTG